MPDFGGPVQMLGRLAYALFEPASMTEKQMPIGTNLGRRRFGEWAIARPPITSHHLRETAPAGLIQLFPGPR
eukprot:4714951-Alexandrium_andersonii.AAC.1